MDRLIRLEGDIDRAVLTSDSPSRTVEIGRKLGEVVPAGTVISLEGGLGVGKTLMAKGICTGLGIDRDVLSPSFILVEEYRGELPVFHFDLYRLTELHEVEELGLYDAVDGKNVVIVEWGDRLPEETLQIDVRLTLRITGPETREIGIETWTELIEALVGREA
ncbi:MAG: tRNA (adenosine(37)-N6)-threonylcarbamoyltransferase complex ATPase subunit type 1 TsaE [bacterium]|nr:MAG: tRNA (adenosine(37)-N6)-threonylcarbamoyltransferase complex ATPase subunit type 1 TsaE [bacterium]